ncbi:hypothetical protein [Legionella quateirensis]|uniref:CopG-like ribbon-helix-helix domain-containing protein n=1 Tax=Legionella quateirensis TaxID=45072 RepID=A0A378KXX9_9GAMM|nr:hypothetical protein [Legionella quateirensis]KTD47807.1 hypothetical protein Lqua_2200 [Legionella quateirensis]STY16700.1 Uncharacterised protein [Legionella quateirensis]
MSRLTVSLPDNLHNRISSLATKNNESMSNIINQLIHIGMHHWNEAQQKNTIKPNQTVEQHCQQLIIQMNALIKNMSVELLKFNQEDFEQLQQAAVGKFNELKSICDDVT